MIEPSRVMPAKRNDFLVVPMQSAISKMSGGMGNQVDSQMAMINSANQPQRLSLHDSTQSYIFLIIVVTVCLVSWAKVIYLFETFNYSTANNQIISVENKRLTLSRSKGLVWCGDKIILAAALNGHW